MFLLCQVLLQEKSLAESSCCSHQGENFQCSSCEKSFSRSDHLQRHIKLHKKEKSPCCFHCSKAFSNSYYLKVHSKTHCKNKPFNCSQCSLTFIYSTLLEKHFRVHSGEKPFSCTEFSKSFAQFKPFSYIRGFIKVKS